MVEFLSEVHGTEGSDSVTGISHFTAHDVEIGRARCLWPELEVADLASRTLRFFRFAHDPQ